MGLDLAPRRPSRRLPRLSGARSSAPPSLTMAWCSRRWAIWAKTVTRRCDGGGELAPGVWRAPNHPASPAILPARAMPCGKVLAVKRLPSRIHLQRHLRWGIESDNKLDKSCHALDQIGARTGPAVRALVHASMVSSMLVGLLAHHHRRREAPPAEANTSVPRRRSIHSRWPAPWAAPHKVSLVLSSSRAHKPTGAGASWRLASRTWARIQLAQPALDPRPASRWRITRGGRAKPERHRWFGCRPPEAANNSLFYNLTDHACRVTRSRIPQTECCSTPAGPRSGRRSPR